MHNHRFNELIARRVTALRRRPSPLRSRLPTSIARWYRTWRSRASEVRRFSRPIATSQVDTIFHCSLYKSGSQWLYSVLSDPVIYRYSGLTHFLPARLNGSRAAASPHPRFPTRHVVSPLHVDRASFDAIPKPSVWRAFFVFRDPRDLLVSWLFSTRDSHPVSKHSRLWSARQELRAHDERWGLHYAIDYWASEGQWDALESWLTSPPTPEVRLVSFEDVREPDGQYNYFAELFNFLGLALPPRDLADLIDAYSFRRLSGGRKLGDERKGTLLRSGGSDWHRYLLDEHLSRLAMALGPVTRKTYGL